MLDILDEYYNLEELRELCFKLGVDYDNLGGEGKRNKARELLLLIYRQDRLAELLAVVTQDRPNVPLPDLPTLRKQATTWRKVSTRAERIRQTLLQNVRSVWVDGVQVVVRTGVAWAGYRRDHQEHPAIHHRSQRRLSRAGEGCSR